MFQPPLGDPFPIDERPVARIQDLHANLTHFVHRKHRVEGGNPRVIDHDVVGLVASKLRGISGQRKIHHFAIANLEHQFGHKLLVDWSESGRRSQFAKLEKT